MSTRPKVIGITGGSGSGKTYVLDRLRKAFNPGEVAFLSQDNYYRDRARQIVDANGKPNFDLPESFEMGEYYRDLQRLVNGEAVERQEYVYNNAEREPSIIRIEPAKVIVAEGLFIMHDENVRSLLDYSVYVSVSDALKLKRRIIRDEKFRNYPLEEVLYRYEFHVLPSYLQYIKPYKSKVNLILNNNDDLDTGLEILTGFIRNLVVSQKR